MKTDPRFPWIDFPNNPKIGQIWVVQSKVMPTSVTWEYRGDGKWECVEDA